MDVVTVTPRDVVVPKRHRFWYVGQLLVVLTTGIVVISRHVPMVGHATEIDLVAVVERTIECLATVVPFPCAPCSETRVAERLPQHDVVAGNAATRIMQVK